MMREWRLLNTGMAALGGGNRLCMLRLMSAAVTALGPPEAEAAAPLMIDALCWPLGLLTGDSAAFADDEGLTDPVPEARWCRWWRCWTWKWWRWWSEPPRELLIEAAGGVKVREGATEPEGPIPPEAGPPVLSPNRHVFIRIRGQYGQ